MKKYKYTYLGRKVRYDEQFIEYLENMSRKGWKLVSFREFAKFKRCDKELKYQIDYNDLSEEYVDVLHSLGYEHICCYNNMHVYANEDLNAPDLSSDEDIYTVSKL